MSKTWKDLPKDVSGYKPFRRRKKPLSDKLKEPPETPMLEDTYDYQDDCRWAQRAED